MNKQLEQCCIKTATSLLDALRALERGHAGVALIVNDANRLLGVLTEPDIRRALLSGAPLTAPARTYMARSPRTVRSDAARANVLDIMEACGLPCMPVVDAQARLCGLHLPHKLVGGFERPNWAVIMAGGRGTRLGALTQKVPKPMLKVAGRPILERLVLHLISHGIRRIFLSINYLGNVIEAHFGDGSRWGVKIDYLREKEAMGTGGSLSLLPARPRTPMFVLNGDLVIESDLGDMLAFHEAGRYYATAGAYRYFHQVPFGCFQIQRGQIRRLEEKPVLSKHINTGVYVLSPAAVRDVPRRFFTMVELLENALQRKRPIGAYEMKEDWIDVGQRDQLKIAREGAVE